MIRVAIPEWQGRVSPVFDVAGRVLLVDADPGAERARRELALEGEDPQARLARLVEAGADVLVCGAISRPLELALASAGIEVISQACGEVERVLKAYLAGELDQEAYWMPGCCGRRRRCRGRRRGQRAKRH